MASQSGQGRTSEWRSEERLLEGARLFPRALPGESFPRDLYPAVVRRVDGVSGGVKKRTGHAPLLYVNATGVGASHRLRPPEREHFRLGWHPAGSLRKLAPILATCDLLDAGRDSIQKRYALSVVAKFQIGT